MPLPSNRIIWISILLADGGAIAINRAGVEGAPVPGDTRFYYARDLPDDPNNGAHGLLLSLLEASPGGEEYILEVFWAGLDKYGHGDTSRGWPKDPMLHLPAGSWTEVRHGSTDSLGVLSIHRRSADGATL